MTNDANGNALVVGDRYAMVGRLRVEPGSGRALLVGADRRAFEVDPADIVPLASMLLGDEDIGFEWPDNGSGSATRYNLHTGRALDVGENCLANVILPPLVDRSADIEIHLHINTRSIAQSGKDLKFEIEVNQCREDTATSSSANFTIETEDAMPSSTGRGYYVHATITGGDLPLNDNTRALALRIFRRAADSGNDPTHSTNAGPLVTSCSFVRFQRSA